MSGDITQAGLTIAHENKDRASDRVRDRGRDRVSRSVCAELIWNQQADKRRILLEPADFDITNTGGRMQQI